LAGACSSDTSVQQSQSQAPLGPTTATGGPAATPVNPIAKPPTNDQRVNLTIAWWGSQDRHNRTIKVIELFQKKYPNIKINYDFGTNPEYWGKIKVGTDPGNLPDIIQHDYAYIDEWTVKGKLLDLDPLVADGTINLTDVPKTIVDGGRMRGKLVGIALGTNTQCFILDVDAFQKAGIPLPADNWTWADFETISMNVKAKLNIPGYGTALYLYTPWQAVYLSSNLWVFNTAGDALGYTEMQDAAWVNFFKMLLRMQSAGTIVPYMEEKTKYPDSANVEALPIITKASAMEQIHSNQLVAMWTKAGLDTRNFVLRPIPRTMATGPSVYIKPAQYFSITAGTKHPKEAAMFLDFFTNDLEANDALAAERGVPINSKVLTALKPKLGKVQAEVFDLIDRVIKDGRPLPPPNPPAWEQIRNTVFIPKVTEPIMLGTLTPEMGVALFRREASALLSGAMPPPVMTGP
jgi:multiple sugar transport system substrate-binding protein